MLDPALDDPEAATLRKGFETPVDWLSTKALPKSSASTSAPSGVSITRRDLLQSAGVAESIAQSPGRVVDLRSAAAPTIAMLRAKKAFDDPRIATAVRELGLL